MEIEWQPTPKMNDFKNQPSWPFSLYAQNLASLHPPKDECRMTSSQIMNKCTIAMITAKASIFPIAIILPGSQDKWFTAGASQEQWEALAPAVLLLLL